MTEYTLIINPLGEEDGGGYMAFYPDLPGCMSDGDTPEEAASNARDALECWMEVQKHDGEEIPKPGSAREAHSRKMEALRQAMISLIDYNDHAEGRIKDLEEELSQLVNAIKSEWQPSQSLLTSAKRSAKAALERH